MDYRDSWMWKLYAKANDIKEPEPEWPKWIGLQVVETTALQRDQVAVFVPSGMTIATYGGRQCGKAADLKAWLIR